MDKEQLAAEARRLEENEATQAAIAVLREDALEQLATVDPTDADTIRKLQARVHVADEFLGAVQGFILNGEPKKAAGIV